MHVLEALGLIVTVTRGRYLTKTERREARAFHGGVQLRAASLRALTIPAPAKAVVEIGDLGTPTEVSPLRHVNLWSPESAQARSKAASRPQRRKPRRRKPTERPPVALYIQKTAAELQSRLPWLRNSPSWRLNRVLEASAIDWQIWTLSDVLRLLDADAAAHGRSTTPPLIHNPLAFITVLLRRAAALCQTTTTEPSRARWAREAAERESREAERARERAEAAAVAAAPMSEETRLLLAEARAKLIGAGSKFHRAHRP